MLLAEYASFSRNVQLTFYWFYSTYLYHAIGYLATYHTVPLYPSVLTQKSANLTISLRIYFSTIFLKIPTSTSSYRVSQHPVSTFCTRKKLPFISIVFFLILRYFLFRIRPPLSPCSFPARLFK